MHLNRRLIRFRGAEHIGTSHRNWRVARNDRFHQAANGFEPHRKGGDIVEHQVAQLTGENSGLHSSANGNHFIGVDVLTRFARHQGAHQLLHHRHAAGTTHQHDLIDIVWSQTGIPQRGLHRPEQAIEQIGAERFEGAPIEAGFQMQGA